MNSTRTMDAPNPTNRLEAMDEFLDSHGRGAGGGFADHSQVAASLSGRVPEQEAPEGWVRLHELLRMPDVSVPAGFAEGVMARLDAAQRDGALGDGASAESTESSRRGSVWSVAAAVLGAAVLLALAMGLGAESTDESILQTIVAGFATAALAGAGLIGATWTGVGTVVGSWLGTSATAGATLAFAALASGGALVWSLRRRVVRQRD